MPPNVLYIYKYCAYFCIYTVYIMYIYILCISIWVFFVYLSFVNVLIIMLYKIQCIHFFCWYTAHQDAAEAKRLKLDYDEITPCLKEVTKDWTAMLNFPKDKPIARNILIKAVRAGKYICIITGAYTFIKHIQYNTLKILYILFILYTDVLHILYGTFYALHYLLLVKRLIKIGLLLVDFFYVICSFT